MLTEEEAIHFVVKVLKVPKPLEKKRENPHGFLNQLISSFHETIPFQSMSLMSLKPEDRHLPTPEEIRQNVVSGVGGLCYTLNTFMKFLLQALDYDVYFVSSHIRHPNNHIITVVQDLMKPGDKHLVDVGVGYPTFEAIPLDFEHESPVYMQSFLEYKLVREGNVIVRWHGRGESRPGVPVVNGWRKVCIIDPTPRNLEFFDEPMTSVYTSPDPDLTPFHTSLRAIIFKDKRAICIKNTSFIVEDENHKLQETKMDHQDAPLEIIAQYFPQLHLLAVKALHHFVA